MWPVYRPHHRLLSTMSLTVFCQSMATPAGTPEGSQRNRNSSLNGHSVGHPQGRRAVLWPQFSVVLGSWGLHRTHRSGFDLRSTQKANCLGQLGTTDQPDTATRRIVELIGSGDRGGLGRRFTRGPLGRQGTGDWITGRRAIRISQGPSRSTSATNHRCPWMAACAAISTAAACPYAGSAAPF